MESIEKIIARQLLEIKAVRLSPEKPFTWASGWKAPIYCDNRKILSYPKAREIVYKSLARLVEQNYSEADVIAGVATGAIAWGMLVAEFLGKPFVYVPLRHKPYRIRLLRAHEIKITQVFIIFFALLVCR